MPFGQVPEGFFILLESICFLGRAKNDLTAEAQSALRDIA
jgi:hypothetical protein